MTEVVTGWTLRIEPMDTDGPDAHPDIGADRRGIKARTELFVHAKQTPAIIRMEPQEATGGDGNG
ncbi:MAG: hypothetical protein ACRDPM_13365 [Solirubrobacteraceae bacterium]